ncbi:amino acid adenylation domain-containing protein [Streptomyces xanthochromogenes]|uniref:non-ribosomal peptide synthetase n=1 Tax=Streptomyces xanthochromogenes TaxID=67384 RepID=UPI0038132B7D
MNNWSASPDGDRQYLHYAARDDESAEASTPSVAAGSDDVIDLYPLSVVQSGMVFHAELDPDRLPHHHVRSFRLHAPFDAALLERTVCETVARHPALRTSFDLAGHEEPVQRVHAAAHLPVHVEDLRSVDPDKQRQVLRELVEDERRRPFDLGRPPLLRLFVHRIDDDVFQWTQTTHHGVLDARACSAFRTEVVSRYLRLLQEPDAPAEPAARDRVRDGVELERSAAGSEEARDHWARVLTGRVGAPLPRLPREEASDRVHATRRLVVPAELVGRLQALAGRQRTDLRTVLLAAHTKVVATATGGRDVVTGVTVDVRPDDANPADLGSFVNLQPLRVDLTGGTWGDLIGQVRDARADALAYRRYPLASIQWDLDDAELFDTTFDFRDHAASDGSPVPCPPDETADVHEPSAHPLATTFLLDPVDGRLELHLAHDPRAIGEAQASEILTSYPVVLDAMTREAERHEDRPVLAPDALHRMLVEWNGPARPYPVHRCVHELVEEQVRRVPDAVAVTDGLTELSFAELNRRANRLARHLRARGAGPETVVAIMSGRTAELAVLLLAVLKSGAAYLPLEPKYPAERLRYMLEDSGARLVLAADHLLERLPEGPWALHPASRATAESAALADDDLGRTSSPENLMYVIYTSGSTGLPKGVQVPHSGVVNYLGWCAEDYASRGAGGAPVFSSIAFDMIVPNLYTPLITGERLCMLDDSLDPVALADRLDSLAPFNFIKMTPGHLDLLDQLLEPDRARRLAATLAVGADSFPTRILDSWRKKDPDSVILNEYGPTEASVGNTVHFADGPISAEQVPIGRAIPNTTMYVLDHAMNPVPVGVPGELYIGGDCVVRGYANKPRLTAERFVPDPFASEPGARMYRTGDLGRWLPEGALEFLGRNDDQLKLNGYRVELGEIEAALVSHPAVRQSVAAVIGKERTSSRLVGYYTPELPVSDAELTAHLADRLPPYMVPSSLVEIDTLPLNANGKVDRKALPVPAGLDPEDGAALQAPRAGTELAVAAAWQDLLDLDEVWRGDNFLDLGGNSIIATQLVFRLRRQGVRVTVADVLRTATLADLAACAHDGEGARQ